MTHTSILHSSLRILFRSYTDEENSRSYGIDVLNGVLCRGPGLVKPFDSRPPVPRYCCSDYIDCLSIESRTTPWYGPRLKTHSSFPWSCNRGHCSSQMDRNSDAKANVSATTHGRSSKRGLSTHNPYNISLSNDRTLLHSIPISPSTRETPKSSLFPTQHFHHVLLNDIRVRSIN